MPDGHADETSPTIENFEDMIREYVIPAQYDVSHDEWRIQDAKARYEDLSQLFNEQHGEEAFPFQPITDEGQATWGTERTWITQEVFEKEARDHPHELFREMRACKLHLLAKMEQVEHLHHEASSAA